MTQIQHYLKCQHLDSVISKELTTVEPTAKHLQPYMKCLLPGGLQISFSLAREILSWAQELPSDSSIQLELDKSGYIHGGLALTLLY